MECTTRVAGCGTAGEEDVEGFLGVLNRGRPCVAEPVGFLALHDAIQDQIIQTVGIETCKGLAKQRCVLVAPECELRFAADGVDDGLQVPRVVRGVDVG